MVTIIKCMGGGLLLLCLGWLLSCCGKKATDTALVAGNPAPSFSLPDQSGVIHTLEQYRGKKVALYFYPKDNTPGCTSQACSLNTGYRDLQDNNIVILGVSYDSVASHQKFIQEHGLQFTLLSDTTKEVAARYGAKGWFWFMPKRKTFLIDEKGTLVKVLTKVDVANHAQEVIQAFKTK